MEVYNGMKTSLKCHCGQRILKRDVMQQVNYDRQFGPSFVYIKYRCSRCKKLGEHFVKQEEWEDSLLHDVVSEVNTTERVRFSKLGKITLDEMRKFHHALERLDTIPATLLEETE
jgi:DNA-directed RNA polymerase subunit RPC12/RpoP